MAQRSPWCTNEQEPRYSGTQPNADLTGSSVQAQLSVSREQLQSEAELQPGKHRPLWAGYWFVQSIKLALNWCWAFSIPNFILVSWPQTSAGAAFTLFICWNIKAVHPMVRMLLGLLELSFFVAAAQKLQLKEKLISLKGFLMRLSLASSFYITSCVSPSLFSLYLNSCLLMTSTFYFPELRIFKKCYW